MRLVLSLGLCAVLAVVPLQDEDKKPLGIPGLRLEEQARVDEELVGTWILLEYRSPREVFERSQYSGFASFLNGYFTFLLHIDVVENRFLLPRTRRIVQAGAHQYRVTGDGRLETATVMGFTNESEDYQLQIEPSAFPRQFQILLEDDLLTLRRWDDLELIFRRVDGSEGFPQRAADVLERYRGRVFTPPTDWGKER